MHRDMLDLQTGNEYKYKDHKKSGGQLDGWTDGRTDGHIILPLRVFETVACGCMCCAQLQAAQITSKSNTDDQTER